MTRTFSEDSMTNANTAERPDYVKCVATGYQGESVSWCGRRLYKYEWHFMDASHAALNGRAEGRLLTCPECAKAIAAALAGKPLRKPTEKP